MPGSKQTKLYLVSHPGEKKAMLQITLAKETGILSCSAEPLGPSANHTFFLFLFFSLRRLVKERHHCRKNFPLHSSFTKLFLRLFWSTTDKISLHALDVESVTSCVERDRKYVYRNACWDFIENQPCARIMSSKSTELVLENKTFF